MPTNHDVVAAVPISAPAVQTYLRNLLVQRMPYVLADSDDMRNIVATDPTTGASIIDVAFLGRTFHYDSTDTTSVYDGVSVLVSYEGRRYKLSSSADVLVYAVLDNTLTVPPVSPALGDAYIVAAAATGAWSGKDNKITVYTSRGWEFITAAVGRLAYVSAGTNADKYYRRKADGSWAAGVGAISLSSNTIPVSSLINVGRTSFIVENQTTNAPPVSPSVGDAYIIGSSPTGAWSGKTAQVAACESSGAWTYYTPTNGYAAYDKSLNVSYRYTGSTWISSGGAIIGTPTSILTASGPTTFAGSGSYTWSATSAPVSTTLTLKDNVGITYQARKTGARLRFFYQYDFTGNVRHVLALYRDSETTALDWIRPNTGACSFYFMFEIAANDAASHTYTVRLQDSNDGSVNATLTRRRFSIEEFA